MNDLIPTKLSYSRTKPYITQIKERTLLNAPHSTKKTYHISLHTSNENLPFLPGDSIGILPHNDPAMVHHLLTLLGNTPEEHLTDPRTGESMNAFSYFCTKVNLSRINSSFLRHLLTKNPSFTKLPSLLLPENKTSLTSFLQGKDLIDILLEFPSTNATSLQELSQHFSPLLPRFYSISSSRSAYPNEVHILVALSSHTHRDTLHYGVASHFLCNLANEDLTPISLYIQPSQHFRLPVDTSKNIIMIGPGTGVAPYRAFLQERSIQGGTGKNWLFFGGRNRNCDFFYEEYWTSLLSVNKLRLSTAFSRDQEEKEYVQHKLLQESQDIWHWLQEGSYFYVCGDASHMAKDVETTLLQIIQEQGSLSQEDAKSYFKSLKTNKRYITDVY